MVRCFCDMCSNHSTTCAHRPIFLLPLHFVAPHYLNHTPKPQTWISQVVQPACEALNVNTYHIDWHAPALHLRIIRSHWDGSPIMRPWYYLQRWISAGAKFPPSPHLKLSHIGGCGELAQDPHMQMAVWMGLQDAVAAAPREAGSDVMMMTSVYFPGISWCPPYQSDSQKWGLRLFSMGKFTDIWVRGADHRSDLFLSQIKQLLCYFCLVI